MEKEGKRKTIRNINFLLYLRFIWLLFLIHKNIICT